MTDRVSVAAEPVIPIDALDDRIIAALREDGRRSIRELAELIAATEATIRGRIRRLEASGTMRRVAMVDLGVSGFEFIAAVGVQVRGRPAVEVAADLAKLDQVLTVAVVIGAQDVEIQVAARDMAELGAMMTDTLPAIAGVARLTAGLAMRIVKYEAQWVPF